MNTGTHVVRNKQVYNLRLLDRGLRKYLEEKSGHSLTKIRLVCETPSFARWQLEGIQDRNYGNIKVGSLFQELCPQLGCLFEGDLLRVCRKVGSKDLFLDFRKKEDLFRHFQEEDFKRLTGTANPATFIRIL